MIAVELTDPPLQLRAGCPRPCESCDRGECRGVDVAARYLISPRLAGDWLRTAFRHGAIAKVGRLFVGRLSALDAWVAAGGQAQQKRKAGAR